MPVKSIVSKKPMCTHEKVAVTVNTPNTKLVKIRWDYAARAYRMLSPKGHGMLDCLGGNNQLWLSKRFGNSVLSVYVRADGIPHSHFCIFEDTLKQFAAPRLHQTSTPLLVQETARERYSAAHTKRRDFLLPSCLPQVLNFIKKKLGKGADVMVTSTGILAINGKCGFRFPMQMPGTFEPFMLPEWQRLEDEEKHGRIVLTFRGDGKQNKFTLRSDCWCLQAPVTSKPGFFDQFPLQAVYSEGRWICRLRNGRYEEVNTKPVLPPTYNGLWGNRLVVYPHYFGELYCPFSLPAYIKAVAKHKR